MTSLKTFLLFASTLLNIHLVKSAKEPESELLENIKIDITETIARREKYQDINYQTLIEEQKTLVFRKKLVREIHLEEQYPDLEPSKCGNSTCKTMMYEITNFNNKKQNI